MYSFMKSRDVAIALLAVALLMGWQLRGRQTNALVGVWEDVNYIVDFRVDGSLELVYKESKYGRRPGIYRVDFSQRPAQLDVRLEDEKVFRTICEITRSGDLRISDHSRNSAQRPLTFGRDIMVFHRLSGKEAIGR